MLFLAEFLQDAKKRLRIFVGTPGKMGDPWISLIP